MRTIITPLLFILLSLTICEKKNSRKLMDDKQQIIMLYEDMYRAMIAKDIPALDSMHADEFELVHMTGITQSKPIYLEAIRKGTLNYYSVTTEHLDIKIIGDSAIMIGQSRVNAAVFGGGQHTWALQLHFTLKKEKRCWLFTRAEASTY